MSILIIIISFLVLLAAGCAFGYVYVQRLYREQKNYERGLKMVPLLIHLPPPSDDTEANGRDVRDIIDENISKAEILYSILASTFKKGLKNKFYGQRHIALEIIASRGFVHFYTAVPVVLVSVVEQAISSAYPNARLEEVGEHNIFSPVGRITGTVGGELSLKESYVYPIATYQDIKRDTMQSILNSLSKLTKDDGAGIQILLRPADDSWRRSSKAEAERKRGGKNKPNGFESVFWWVGQAFTALTKPPDTKDADRKDSEHEPSSLDQSVSQAIEEKTKQPGYEVLIRVVASSNVSHRAQSILNNIVASFALFDAPGKNGFKFTPAKDIDSFVTAYILRFFPQGNSGNILSTTELATLFHFPDQSNIPTSQLERQASKQVDGPRNMPEEGLLLGYNMFRGAKKPIKLSPTDRQRHMYAVGQTGTGKSTFLENLALQDMLEGRGFAFVDPHGDTAERLLAMVPKERTEDVIYFCPADMDYPLGLNMFEYHSPDQKDFLIQEAINMLYKLYDPTHSGIIGPRYEHLFRNAALTVMADPNGGSFVDIPKLFRDPAYVKQKLKYVTDMNVLEFWQKEMPQSQRSSEFGEIVSWFVSKFGAFLSNDMMRNIIGQNKSAFDLREVMDSGKILLVNLSRGRTGDLNSKLLGMIFVMKFEAAAMSRADIPEEYRQDFCLYVDEFQNFSTDSFADILSQARKFHLNLIVANQFTTQLSEEVRDAVFGNVGTVVSFRVGTTDAEFLVKQFAPVFDIDDLQFLPNANTVVRMMIGGVPVQPFSMATLPPLGTPNTQLMEALKQLSAAKYGRPKVAVETEIFKRLTTEQPQRLAPAARDELLQKYGLGPTGGIATSGRPPAPNTPAALPVSTTSKPSNGSSFLEEWLAKRKTTTPNPTLKASTTTSSPGTSVSSVVPPIPSVAPALQPAPDLLDNAQPGNPTGDISGSNGQTQTTDIEDVPKKIGELKINHQDNPGTSSESDVDGDGFQKQVHSVRIDRDGNLSFDDN